MSRAGDRPVVVVGGGLAGLTAAWLLARRKVPVRVLEVGGVLGGKLASETLAGPHRSIEHGVHGWWPTYRAVDWLLRELGTSPDDALEDARSAGVFHDPGRLDVFPGRGWQPPSPLHLVWHGRHATGLEKKDVVRLARFSVHALAYRHEHDFYDYDRMSLAELCDLLGVSAAGRTCLLEPFARLLSYTGTEDLSAGVALSALEFYFLRAGARVLPRWGRKLPHAMLLEPLRAAVEACPGSSVETQSPVLSVTMDRGVRAVLVLDPEGTDELGRVPVGEVPAEGFVRRELDGVPVLLGRRGRDVRCFQAVCTHAGGPVDWNAAASTLICARHGARFREDGSPATPGLAKAPLVALDAQIESEHVVVRSVRRIEADDVIVATDVGATQKILGQAPEALRARLASLRTTRVVVIRLWFLRALPGSNPRALDQQTIQLVDPTFADALFRPDWISELEDGCIVVELHVADPTGSWSARPDRDLLERARGDVERVYGPLEEDPSRPPIIGRHETFTRHAPGSGIHRPGARTPVRGLYLAGDWTRVEVNAWFLEHAVVSGLRASNAVLARYGLAPLELDPPRQDGLLLRTSRRLARWARGPLRERSGRGPS